MSPSVVPHAPGRPAAPAGRSGPGGPIPDVGSGRDRVTILRRDDAAMEDGTWQSGRLRHSNGRERRFIARGIRLLPAGAEADVRGHVEPCPAAVSGWVTDREQVVIDECYGVHLPVTGDGVAAFIAGNVEGVGPSRAAEIVRRLGGAALGALAEDPALLERVFPGKVGRDLAFCWRRWQAGWDEHRKAYDLALRLASRGVQYRHALRIMRFFRSADVAEIVLLRRPYRLLDVPGFGWRRADHIARQLGVAADAPDRLAAAAAAALDEAAVEDGHSCLPAKELARRAAERAGSVALAEQGVRAAVEAGVVIADGGLCYRPAALEAEWVVGRHVRRRAAVVHEVPADAQALVAREIATARLTLAQAGAVWEALTRGVFVLTGGPGTGKTTAVRTIVRCAAAMGLRFKVVAPTGKAAARATEVTGAQAETVHRLVGGPPGGRRASPLDLDLVIVDETSMASVEVAAWLLDNLRPSARVVVVGDADQLPSVDHGAVLRDLLASARVPAVRLLEVHRQAAGSGIVANAYRVLRREPLEAAPDFRVVDVTARHVRASVGIAGGGPADAGGAAEKAAARAHLVAELRALQAAGVDVAADVQVLTPVKKLTNALGVHALNRLLQGELNSAGAVGPEIGAGRRAQVGDRVMQTRNDYTLGETGVFNGEVGEVVAVGPDAVTVRFDERRSIPVTGYRLYNLQLAWATTIHRSQGSEWRTVIVVLHRSHGAMLTRELLYTAVTRAKERVVVIADEQALALVRADAQAQGTVRHTGLGRHLSA